MKPGEKFEIECYTYLKEKYENEKVSFIHHDTADSTGSDIEVIINGKNAFFIEAKDMEAQSGQFVLFANEEKQEFVFSSKNRSEQNELTAIIIEYMNGEFDWFKTAGTSGKKLEINSSFFVDWIVRYYKSKNVKYVISKKSNYFILPIEKFGEYFDVNANFRIKKSGSGEPALKYTKELTSVINNAYGIDTSYRKFVDGKDRMFVTGDPSLKDLKIEFKEYTYQLRKRDGEGHLFEVRRLSNTKHKNVIFNISAKKEQVDDDLKRFECEILV